MVYQAGMVVEGVVGDKMKLTTAQLRRIIKEEAESALKTEGIAWDPSQSSAMSQLQTLIGDLVAAAKRARVSKADLLDEIATSFEGSP